MISWAYYGERGRIYLLDHFGGRGVKTLSIYRAIFVFFVFVGSVAKLGAVLDFALSVIDSNELYLLIMLSVHLLDIVLDVQDALLSNVLEADSAGKL